MKTVDVTFVDDLEYASIQGKLKGRYGLVQIIGYGGFAQVWKAIDFQTGNYCAVKDYSKDSLGFEHTKHIIDTYRLFQDFHHPNLLQTLDCFIENGIPYIVNPYYPKRSIESQRGSFSEHELLHLLNDVAGGLEHMHSGNHLHMDIKPSNILLSNTGDFIISDFGISYKIKDIIRQAVPLKTKDTEAYMAPERFSLREEISYSSDIWSLGSVVYEMATGKTPFGMDGGKAQLSSMEDITSINIGSQYSTFLNNLVRACLNPVPKNRPTAQEIVNFVNFAPKIIFADNACLYTNELGFRNKYTKQAIKTLISYRIVRRNPKSYGIIDNTSQRPLVNFLYDSIEPFAETSWPGPGPLPPPEEFFLGAFFKQGGLVGFLRICDDGSIEEYKKCTWEEYHRRCQFT